jgi:glycosyltransferase involved in cell wall biosynthesis
MEKTMKVAIVHYWLVGMRGGEKVVEEICKLYPDADIFTLVADPSKLSPTINEHRIRTSFLQSLGGVKHYQKFLPLMPFALERFDLTDYDLVISSEAGPAKAIITRPDALHICYCHSPMRYIWDCSNQYLGGAGWLSRLVMYLSFPLLRVWDVTTSARVDHFIANSQFVAKRIEKFYRRKAVVINPPVNVERFGISDVVDDYYLCAGQITPYKKIELAVEACTQLSRKLLVLGAGATPALRKMAGPTVTFEDEADDLTMERHFARCKALLYPGVEDFGIVPLEVMASGRPVIAMGRGGASETVVDGRTGVFFYEQTVDALVDAIATFEEIAPSFSPEEIRRHALSYSNARFQHELSAFISARISEEGASILRLKPPAVEPVSSALAV